MYIRKQYHKDVIRRLQNHPKYNGLPLERLVEIVKMLFPQYREVDISSEISALRIN